jgi:translation elongation factor EF-1beta
MGKVLTVLKIFPDEDFDLEKLRENVSKVEGCNTSKIIDFVFGSKIIRASFVCNDGENKDFEEIIRATVQGVSEVQVEEVGLVS